MIDRFNFYDIYGYFIPGALLIALLWIPHAIAAGEIPSTEISAALVAVVIIVVPYIAGHILQIVAARALPSKILFRGAYRAPSDLLLSVHPRAFPVDFRLKVMDAIRYRLGIDVTRPANRGQAFFLCRDTVIASKTSSYVEQFEGMYAMMRGLAAATGVGFAYDIGWLIADWIEREPVFSVVGFLLLGSAAAWVQVEDHPAAMRCALIAFILLTVAAAGSLAADGSIVKRPECLTAATISAIAAVLAFGAYREFTWAWATSVYRHFYLIVRTPQKKES